MSPITPTTDLASAPSPTATALAEADLLSLTRAAHHRWNPVWVFVLASLLLVLYLYMLLMPLLAPLFHDRMHHAEYLPAKLFTWVGSKEDSEREKEKELDGGVEVEEPRVFKEQGVEVKVRRV